MEEIICYTDYLPEGTKQTITFMELLLDDRWVGEKFECPQKLYSEIGNVNDKLTAKQNYEFLLRAAKKYPVTAIGAAPQQDIISSDNKSFRSLSFWNAYRTDCYIAGYFNLVIETLLQNASEFPNHEEATAWLEKMISHAPEYYEIDDDTRPILIYRGDSTCYNILNLFADELAKALRSCRQRVEIFDIEKEGHPALTRLINRRFKAIIGVQTHVFSVMMQDRKTNLHDLIIGPKYNMILDHPAWMKQHIENGPADYYLLIHDRNYLSFVSRYYKNIKQSFYFPPGGISPAHTDMPFSSDDTALPYPAAKKQYDFTFIGSYYDYRKRLALIHSYDRLAFREALEYYKITLNDTDFLDLFYEMRQTCYCAMTYYREKIIRTLLDAGITIHVYGDTWNNAPFASCPNLIRHPAVSAEESLPIMEQSRLSLNIMSWHKDGLTERVLNAMLCQSAVLSDRSGRLEETFINGQDLLFFSLKQLHTLPTLVTELLSDEERLQKITRNGYEKARQNHRWKNRAEEFLKILNRS